MFITLLQKWRFDMLKKEPKVLLIYPPNQLMDIEVPRPDGSLGILYLAGALRQEGIEVDVLDASVGSDQDNIKDTFFRRVKQPNGLTRIGMTIERIREFVAQGKYNIVGISSIFTPQTSMVLKTARAIKDVSSGIFVIAGGVNAQALAPRLLVSKAIDLIIISEAEKTIVSVVRAWQSDACFESLDAVAFMKNGEIITKPATPDTTYSNLDNLPIPAWDLLPFKKYENINSPHGSILPGTIRRYAPIMTSRGCPYACLYCHISEEVAGSTRGDIGTLRLKSVDRVMKEINILRDIGVTHLYFEDDSLLAKKSRVKELFTRILSIGGLKISDVNGVNLIHFGIPSGGKLDPDREYLELMKSAGFDEIVFPVESGSQRILDTYASGKLNLERFDVVQLVRVAVSVGIACPINMMIGFPDETENEIMQSVDLAKQLIGAGAPYVTFFIPIPFPGSKLFDLAIRGGYLSPDFDPDRFNWKNAVMNNTAVSPERIEEIRDWAWTTVNTDDYKRRRIEREIGTRVASST